MDNISIGNNSVFLGHGKQVVVGDTDYFQALKQHERTVAETDLVYE